MKNRITWRERIGYALIIVIGLNVVAARAVPPYTRDPVSEGVLVALGEIYNLLAAPVAPTPTSSAVTEGAVTVTASSAQVLAGASRRYLYLENLSASASISCRFAAAAALNTAGSWSLLPYASKVWEGSYVPSDAINCIGSTSSVPLTVLSK